MLAAQAIRTSTARTIVRTLSNTARHAMPPKRSAPGQSPSPGKKPRTTATKRSPSPSSSSLQDLAGHGKWRDWPAPQEQMERARSWIRDW